MKYERDAPILPTVERVRAASEEFNKENSVIEQALKELFGQYRGNNNHPHVLLKVVALNRLYSAGILGVHDAAYHIYQHAQEIDAALTDGAPEAVDRIAKVKISSSGKQLKFWSFASKYCSWHNQPSYPIWDSRVCRYLTSLKGTPFAHPDLWTHYKEFRELMVVFRDHYELGSLSFKEIDAFLWKYGAKLPAPQI